MSWTQCRWCGEAEGQRVDIHGRLDWMCLPCAEDVRVVESSMTELEAVVEAVCAAWCRKWAGSLTYTVNPGDFLDVLMNNELYENAALKALRGVGVDVEQRGNSWYVKTAEDAA